MSQRKAMHPTAKFYQGKHVPGYKKPKISRTELVKEGITATKRPTKK